MNRRTARLSISEITLAKNPGSIIEHAMRTLEKELGGPPEDIRTYSDPASMSLIIEASRPDDPKWISSSGYSSGVSGSLTYDDLKRAANDYKIFQQQYYYPAPPQKVYLTADDDQELPEEPEPMWSTETIVGWRLFAIYQGRLRGQHSHTWSWKTLTAICTRQKSHQVPAWDCECGIYASSYPPTPASAYPVIAEVSLTGRVIEHEYGYRAERATILRLWASKENHQYLTHYGVPVLPRR